jgi:GTP-binding protein
MIIHVVDAASTEGRDPIEDIYAINKELANYNSDLGSKKQIIAANKLDMLTEEEAKEVVDKIKAEFEPKGVKVFPLSTLTGMGLKELLYYVSTNLEELGEKPIVYDQEYDPEVELKTVNEAFTVEYDSKEHEYVVEGPKIEKMLGYTNLDSEKGFAFFQNFLAENGILDRLEELNIQEGDTVRMYGLAFDYYRNADTKSPDDTSDEFDSADFDMDDIDMDDFDNE